MRYRGFSLFIFFLISCCCHAQTESKWKYIGPHKTEEQVKGLFKSLWVNENNLNHVLAGSSSGGLFESRNAMDTCPVWKNITDTYPGMNYGVSAIVVTRENSDTVIYIATGHNSGLPKGYGTGILKSNDRGKSWRQVGPPAPAPSLFCMEGLVMNRENTNEMICYTAKQVFITRNAWQSFAEVKLPVDASKEVSFCDADFAPFENGKFYICTRTNNHLDAKIFVCSNYGEINSILTPTAVASERIEICTMWDKKYKGKFYYACGTHDAYVGFYNGKEHQILNKAPVNHVFSGTYWNLELSVNNADTNILYLSMTETSRSTDGGKSFHKIANYNAKNTHADVRDMLLLHDSEKGTKDALFLANDGGISFLKNPFPAEWRSLNGIGLDANQFWGADVAQSDSLFFAGGAQDNGGFLMYGNSLTNTMRSCGDGYLGTVIDDRSAIIQCNTPSLYFHEQKGTLTYLAINDPGADPRRPMLLRDSFFYIGHHQLWKISVNDLKNGKVQFTQFTFLDDSKRENGSIRNQAMRSFSFGKKSAVISYGHALWDDKNVAGKLYYCTDVFAQKPDWQDISPAALLKSFEYCRWTDINSLMIDPNDDATFYFVARDEYDQTNCKLVRMKYNSDSVRFELTEINGNLPKLGINDIKIDKYSDLMYVACDDGVYITYLRDGEFKWEQINDAKYFLPKVKVSSLAFNHVANTLVAATYGRGVWQTELISSLKNSQVFAGKKTIHEAFKIDGQFTLKRKAELNIKGKLIITSGSKITLNKGSKLIIDKKANIRNEHNAQIELGREYLIRSKGKVVYRN